MKLAFLVLAHTDISQLKRRCNKLVDYGYLYIHVDKKTNSEYYNQLVDYVEKELNGKVIILKDRVNVWWGGYSMVHALVKLLMAALDNSQPKYDRMFLISGLCYPLFSPSQLTKYCEGNNNKELMTVYNISQGNNMKQKQRVVLYHFFRDINLPFKSIIRRGVIAGTRLLLKYAHFRKKPYMMINGVKWDIYYSSTWISLTDGCWRFVLDHLVHNRKLIKYFKTSYVPDEMVIPTIVMNSEYRESVSESAVPGLDKISSLHYLHYTDHIWTYDESEYEILLRSNRPFVRKLVSDKSEKLIKMIDNYHTHGMT